MSQYLPESTELLTTVQQYLKGLSSKLMGGDKYDALVASYLISICERELKMGSSFNMKEKEVLVNFLKSDDSLEGLQKTLCEGVREGNHDGTWDELLELILSQTVNNVSVVRPDHLAEMHRPSKT
jgi:hypothetical protein